MKTLQNKLLTLITALVLIGGTAMAQFTKIEIPKVVTANFMAKYPQAHIKRWKVAKDTCTSMFMMDNIKYSASYTSKGKWLYTERFYSRVSGLPMAIQSYLKKGEYASWHIDNIEILTTPTNSMYVVQLDNHDGGNGTLVSEGVGLESSKTLFFDTDGKLVNSTNSMFSY